MPSAKSGKSSSDGSSKSGKSSGTKSGKSSLVKASQVSLSTEIIENILHLLIQIQSLYSFLLSITAV